MCRVEGVFFVWLWVYIRSFRCQIGDWEIIKYWFIYIDILIYWYTDILIYWYMVMLVYKVTFRSESIPPLSLVHHLLDQVFVISLSDIIRKFWVLQVTGVEEVDLSEKLAPLGSRGTFPTHLNILQMRQSVRPFDPLSLNQLFPDYKIPGNMLRSWGHHLNIVS